MPGPSLKEVIIRRNHTQRNYIPSNSYTEPGLAKKRIPEKCFEYSGAKLWNTIIYSFSSHAKLAQSF